MSLKCELPFVSPRPNSQAAQAPLLVPKQEDYTYGFISYSGGREVRRLPSPTLKADSAGLCPLA